MSYHTSSKRSPPFWLLIGARKTQRPERPREFPHIAPEIVGGFRGQSVASDIFSLTKIAETIFRKAELGHLPVLFVQALNADPTKRPSLDKIIAIM
ncbi:unnamed protein product [Porites evermanni]|uniref:Protein kinase domain-containing protein n=1 Tax=Porites evermanni TaxID=104178 RepID=A0ABN8LYK4_9CNID|nr:unnamed protein product [Porites evermanni]